MHWVGIVGASATRMRPLPAPSRRRIVSALRRPRLAVYAPRSMGAITKSTGVLPRVLGNAYAFTPTQI